jgi:hypothetical protein
MMTIPPEMIDFIHITNATCTVCVQKAKLSASADRPAVAAAAPVGSAGKVWPGRLVAADKGTLRWFGGRSQDR